MSREFLSVFLLINSMGRYEVLCDGCPGVLLPQDCSDSSMNVAFLSPPAFDSEFYSDDVSLRSVLFHFANDRCSGCSECECVSRPRNVAGLSGSSADMCLYVST